MTLSRLRFRTMAAALGNTCFQLRGGRGLVGRGMLKASRAAPDASRIAMPCGSRPDSDAQRIAEERSWSCTAQSFDGQSLLIVRDRPPLGLRQESPVPGVPFLFGGCP
jgi:hypothetical protein